MPASEPRPEVYETQWKDTRIDELMTPTLFPYAIAAVCTRWREIMSTVPEFWTRVVIIAVPHVGSETFQSPTHAHSYFEWSRDLILDVTIIDTSARGLPLEENLMTHQDSRKLV
ncbi:hypothetical protein SERLADRAFT_379729 [Serpula lacrymans var. lacrymans S7.9]|uniref:F-box domain-containing protein n=2 Tax=Serpula lacrymans var. lacrymans TaxID=341189 RepID=F8NJJ0_SERL9|nr:uncharacterized protein SERLADRAFT_379729 [Serpula lacrymans var. lacrymans S7.9]EGO30040.1 hypothetical protein SERLADRAFT_379729 [Serpula lacrymans var. lacrymans S7.9]